MWIEDRADGEPESPPEEWLLLSNASVFCSLPM